MKKISLYIHIPFCRSKCKYCAFASFSNLNKDEIEKYINFVCEEIKYQDDNLVINTIYFGGGTPSILSKEDLNSIFSSIKEKFIISEKLEITIESNPNDINKNNLNIWKKLGINRISIGVQTLNKKSLKKIGRDDKGDIFRALDLLKNYQNFFSIGLDFIVGLPYVKKGDTKKDIEKLLAKYQFIDNISVYLLEGKIGNYHKDWKSISLKEEDYLGEYVEVKNFLNKNEYIRYEISNYAKKGFESIHNKAYWTHKEYIGIGLGAHSFYKMNRYFNSDIMEEYYNFKKVEKEPLSENDIFLEKLMFGLRTDGISDDLLCRLNKQELNYFILNGYLKGGGDKIILEDKGVLLLDHILEKIV